MSIARRTDPETSHAAGESLRRSGAQATAIQAAAALVRSMPGRTYSELHYQHMADAETTGVPAVFGSREGLQKRLHDASKRRLIYKGPARRCGLTGKAAQTWWPV